MILKRLASALWILEYPLKAISISNSNSNSMALQHRHPLGARFSLTGLFHIQSKGPHYVNINTQTAHRACLCQSNNINSNNTSVKAMVDQYSRVGQSEGAGRDDLERLVIRGVPLGRQSNRLPSEKLVVAVDIDEVLGNFLFALNTFMAERYFLNHNIAEYHVYNFDKVWKCSLAEANVRVHEFFKSKHFREGIHPIPGAYQALHQLTSFCHFSIATSRQNVIKQQTIDWVESHYSGLFREIHFGNHFSFDGEEKSKSEICRCLLTEFHCIKVGNLSPLVGLLLNEVVIDVKEVEPNLDTLSCSNGRRDCMVEKLIPTPFQQYMEVPLTPHG